MIKNMQTGKNKIKYGWHPHRFWDSGVKGLHKSVIYKQKTIQVVRSDARPKAIKINLKIMELVQWTQINRGTLDR